MWYGSIPPFICWSCLSNSSLWYYVLFLLHCECLYCLWSIWVNLVENDFPYWVLIKCNVIAAVIITNLQLQLLSLIWWLQALIWFNCHWSSFECYLYLSLECHLSLTTNSSANHTRIKSQLNLGWKKNERGQKKNSAAGYHLHNLS